MMSLLRICSEIESSLTELPVQDATGSEPEVTGTVTPQSSESKESEWTNVDKSESDDWEQEFDEINETTKVMTSGSNLTNNNFFRIKKKQRKKQKFKMKMKKQKRVTIGTTGHKMTHLVSHKNDSSCSDSF